MDTPKLEALTAEVETLDTDSKWYKVYATLDTWTQDEIRASLPQLLSLVEEIPKRTAPGSWLNFDETHAAWPLVNRLRIWDEGVDDETLTKIAEFEPLQYVKYLELPENPFGLDGLRALADSSYIQNVVHLDLAENSLGAEGLEALAKSTNLTSLEYLDIADCKVGDEGVEHLATSELARRLKHLNLHKNGLTDKALRSMANSEGFEHLEVLLISMNSISNEGACELFKLPKISKLKYLEVWGNQIKDEAIVYLAKNAPNLETLEAGNNQIGAEGLRALADAQASKSLVKLKLDSTIIGDDGADILLQADFPSLKELDISWAGIGDEQVQVLKDSKRFGGLSNFNL